MAVAPLCEARHVTVTHSWVPMATVDGYCACRPLVGGGICLVSGFNQRAHFPSDQQAYCFAYGISLVVTLNFISVDRENIKI